MIKRAEEIVKSFLLRLLAALFRVHSSVAPFAGTPGRILVVRQDNRIGNLIFILPLLELLRKRFPSAGLGLIAGGRFPDLLASSGLITRVHCYDQLRFIRRPWLFFRFLREVRTVRYDLVIDAKRAFSVNNFLLTALSGATSRIGFVHPGTERIYHREVPVPPDTIYEPEILAALFSAFEARYAVPAPRLPVSEALRATGRDALGDKKPVAIHPGARGGKRWPTGHFAAVCEGLLKNPDINIVVFLGPDEKGMERFFPQGQRLQVVKPAQASDMAALLSRCRLLFCCDTGALHLAAAVGVPTLSVFLTTNPHRLAPKGGIHHVLDGSNGEKITPEKALISISDIISSNQNP